MLYFTTQISDKYSVLRTYQLPTLQPTHLPTSQLPQITYGSSKLLGNLITYLPAFCVFRCLSSPSMALQLAVHTAQAPSQLWPKVEARVRRALPSLAMLPHPGRYAAPPASSLSVGKGMQCYIHLRCLGRADLTLPEEVGPYLCKWQRGERGLIPPTNPSFIPVYVTVKPHLLFSSAFLLTTRRIYPEGFLAMDQICFFVLHLSMEEVRVYLQLSH